MLLLDTITDYRTDMVRTGTVITSDHPFASAGGQLESTALIETLAQAGAALRGCEAVVNGREKQRIGYLTGLRRLEIGRPAWVGDSLTTEVRQVTVLGQAAVMEGRVLRGDDCLAVGTLNVWEEIGPGSSDESNRAQRPANPAITGLPHPKRASPMHRAVCACGLPLETNRERSEATGEFCFEESFAGFQGHFPTFAILPGIIMLKISLLLCDGLVGHTTELVSVERAKFKSQVWPGQYIRARVHVDPMGDGWRVTAGIVESETGALIHKLNATVERANL